MGGELEQTIAWAIQMQARKLLVKQVISGIATKVDEFSCTVERDDAPTLYDVRLNAVDENLQNYMTVYPAVDSVVLVGIIDNLTTEAVVLRCSEIEKIVIKIEGQSLVVNKDGFVFNDGNNGMVKIDEMVKWMKKVSSDLQALKTLLQTSPVAGNGSPLAITFSPTTPTPEQSTFEDPNIKH